MNILITGGNGFIGSNFLNKYVPFYPQHQFINIDKLTYASNNLDNLLKYTNYSFFKEDILNFSEIDLIFKDKQPELVIHFAAESHVDNSIKSPTPFINSNIIGTFNILEACRINKVGLLHYISTDEVYGSLDATGFFTEKSRIDPSSPYSASKAAADHLVRAWHRTYGLPIKITNCSNNYGPMQHKEKLIPLMISNIVNNKPLPIYGTGMNIRDWLFVDDHCDAIWTVINKGRIGETYNIGGNNELTNIEIVNQLIRIVSEETGEQQKSNLITYVPDRPGHDKRYAIDSSKIQNELGWKPKQTFETGLRKTVQWYLK